MRWFPGTITLFLPSSKEYSHVLPLLLLLALAVPGVNREAHTVTQTGQRCRFAFLVMLVLESNLMYHVFHTLAVQRVHFFNPFQCSDWILLHIEILNRQSVFCLSSRNRWALKKMHLREVMVLAM